MKKVSIIGILLLLCIVSTVKAQVPAGIPYQAVARNTSGNLIVSQTVGIRFRILSDTPAAGTVWFEERHTPTTTDLGQINLTIGSGTLLSGNFATIPWEHANVRLQVDMDPAGGTSYSVSGVTVFGTVPYAFRSGSSSLSGNGVPNGTVAGQTLRWNGTGWVAASNMINNGTNISINPGTSAPDLALTLGDNVSQEGGIVAKGKYGTGGLTLNTTGDGVRMIWYPKKAAFRAGYTTGNTWDDSQIGLFSWAGGFSSRALGDYSFAFGAGNYVSGDFSASMGSGNQVSGEYSAAFGQANQVAGYWSFAAGQGNVVSNSASTAFGYSNTVSATYSLASGWANKVGGQYATALGYYNSANGDFSFSGGSESSARGNRSMAFGQGVIARSWSEIALGSFNTDYTPQDSTTFNSNDRIFVIGNGNYSGRKNALVILKNGNLGIGEDIPSETFVIGSGGKFRIDSLGNVKRINNVAYSWPAVQGNNNQFLKNDGAGNLSWAPVAASASDITSGTLDDARLSANIFRLNATQTVSANHSFQDGTLRLWNAVSSFPTILSAPSATISRTLTFPDASGTVITTGNLGQITGTGAITSGTWMGSTIGPQYGGTGLNTAAALAGSIFYTNTVGSWAVLGPGTNGQILSMVAGTPAWISNSGAGTVTSIATGTGLTGGPITGSGTISVATGGISTSLIADGAVTSTKILDGTITGADINSSAVLSVSSVTATGSITSSSAAGFVNSPFGALSGNTSEHRFLELASNGTNYVGFKAADALSANRIWTLPAADGSSGQVLSTNGTGVLSWNTPTVSASAITGTLGPSSLPSTIAYKDAGNVFSQGQFISAPANQTALKITSAPGQTAPLTSWYDNSGSSVAVAEMSKEGLLTTKGMNAPYGNFVSDPSGVYSPLRIWAAATQSDPLTEWRSSTGTNLATVSATGVFTGNGSGLTNLSVPASGITGTLGPSSLPSSIAYEDSSNVFTKSQFIRGSIPNEAALKIAGVAGQTTDLTSWYATPSSNVPLAAMSQFGVLSARGISVTEASFISDPAGVFSPVRIIAAATQSDPLTEWRSSTGTNLATVSATGVFTGNGSGLTNVTASSSTPVGGDLSGTIGNAQLAAGSVGAAEIVDGSVASADIADLSIGTADLANNSVNAAKIIDGSIATADISDNSVNGAKLAMGSDALGDMLVYNGVDYVRLAAGANGQILKMSGGTPVWSNPTGMISTTLVNSSGALTPSSTLGFISPTVSVTLTAGQKVLVDVTCALGAGATAANALAIYPGYKLSTGTTVVASGNGIFGLTCPANTRLTYSVTGQITGLAAGTYQFGMIGSTTSPNWTNNDFCYTRAVVVE